MKRIGILKVVFILVVFAVLHSSCSKDKGTSLVEDKPVSGELVIFHVNDMHGSLENYAKVKHIVDAERKEHPVLLVSAGDIFSGNPVVDNYPEKGYPMVEIMNSLDFDLSVLGNHEFDYGEQVLAQRLEQSAFPWICANITTQGSAVAQPEPYTTLTVENIDVTFVGLVETDGKENEAIPSTHPWRVQNFTFQPYQEVAPSFLSLREEQESDLVVALTHLGKNSDFELAKSYPFMDMIIGGHSHSVLRDEVVNNVPVFQAGSNLRYLGKITVQFTDGEVTAIEGILINLDAYSQTDSQVEEKIASYKAKVNLDEELGESAAYHGTSDVGCLYTEALRTQLKVDFSLQNTGGIRAPLDAGTITKEEVLTIDPFTNGSVIYTMTVAEVKRFLQETGSGFYYSGVRLAQANQQVLIYDEQGNLLPDTQTLTLGVNDYIPAVHDAYFHSEPDVQPYTTAELLMMYLRGTTAPVDFTDCRHYFRFQ